jgi:hypothetical protein
VQFPQPSPDFRSPSKQSNAVACQWLSTLVVCVARGRAGNHVALLRSLYTYWPLSLYYNHECQELCIPLDFFSHVPTALCSVVNTTLITEVGVRIPTQDRLCWRGFLVFLLVLKIPMKLISVCPSARLISETTVQSSIKFGVRNLHNKVSMKLKSNIVLLKNISSEEFTGNIKYRRR